MRKLYIFLLTSLSPFITAAQQSDLSNMYPLNYYLINSAATGKDSTWQIFTGYRKQWTGISNSPIAGYLGASGRVGKNQGAGLFVEQSKYGLLSDFNAKLSYAYHVTLSPGNSLHVGASIGLINRSLRTSEVIASDYSDELLAQNSLTGTRLQSDIGIMFTSRRLLLGVSLPQLIPSSGAPENKTSYYIMHGGYDVISNETWLLQATAAFRKNGSSESQTDIGARALWKNQFGGGIGYRTLNGLFVRAEVNLQNRLAFAYSYEHGTSSTGRSHEFMVSIRFAKKKKNPTSEVSEESSTEEPVQNTEAVAEDTAVNTVATEPERKEPVPSVKEQIITEKKIVNKDSINKILEGDRLIFFETPSSDIILSKNYESTIALVSQILKENPELKVTIVGHTCKLGTENFNHKISEDRAHQVFSELERSGISPKRMTYIGKGESEPLQPGDSPEQLARNRRVQIKFSLMTE